MNKKRLFAGIDAGGTTFKLGVIDEAGEILGKIRVPTTTPDETIAMSTASLRGLAEAAGGEIAALGIASFGPVDVDPQSPDYGTILNTPKSGWRGTRLRERMAAALNVPAFLETDVNAALLAERAYGAAQGTERAAYVTIGTGVGVGVQINGIFAGQPFHPELGHIRVERHRDDENFVGVCGFHRDCLEGVLSAPALIARFGALEKLTPDHACWRIAGWYVAQLCLTLSLGWRVQRIVLGGGVMNSAPLLHEARRQFTYLSNNYLSAAESDAATLIQRADLGDDAGLMGALELVKRG